MFNSYIIIRNSAVGLVQMESLTN